MRVHVLQHVPFEGLGSIDAWLRARDAVISTTRFFESPSLPALDDFDVLIALGGPMSVNDETELRWLGDEKRFVKSAILGEKPVLGICLGAQLMAASLGARVYPGESREIGWFPVQPCQHRDDCFAFPAQTEVFHWHGETFDLPAGAVHLARSSACAHQAFQIGRRAIGLQFHLETTPEMVDTLIAHCRNELSAAPFVQSEEMLRAAPASRYVEINALMDRVLDYLTRSGA